MSWLAIPALLAAAYYLLALLAALRWRRRVACARAAEHRGLPPISILKAVRGRDPGFYDAIRSHAVQDYPAFEMLFGFSDPHDPAAADVTRLQSEFPHVPISLHYVSTAAPNTKVGVLADLARRASHPILLINDSDILVEPGYLRAAAAPLADAAVGLVTCLYRASANGWPARFEALGIATEFAPSVLTARLLGMQGFALGSTMALRAADLAKIGGFDALTDCLADDFHLGRRIHQLGRRIEFADTVVETALGAPGWPDVWRHQLRWSRTIRAGRTAGYYGYIVTHATVWALAAFAAGQWWAGALALALRMAAGVAAASVLRYRPIRREWPLIPLRDLFGFAVWLGGAFGRTVVWRGRRLRLLRDGRIETV